MGKNKQVNCKVCYREMRSDNVKRHMKLHLKLQPVTTGNEEMCRELLLELVDQIVDPVQEDTERKEKHVNSAQEHSERKRKFEEPSKFFNNNPYLEKLKKVALHQQEEYEEKVNLGRNLYKILHEGVVTEESFPKDWKDALDIYMKQGTETDCENVELKPWQTELMKWIKNLTDRHVIWVVGTACGEGKTFFQKYVRSMFGRKRVVANGSNESPAETLLREFCRQNKKRFSDNKRSAAMAATNLELSKFFDHFYRLKNTGQKANLYVGFDAWGQVFVNLQVHLGPHPREPAQHSQGYQDGHHHTRPEAERYHRHHRPHPEPHHHHHDQPRARPSRLRRIERRKQARAAVGAKKSAENVVMQNDIFPRKFQL